MESNIANRNAITDRLNSYSFYWDDRQFDKWLGLFADNVVVEMWIVDNCVNTLSGIKEVEGFFRPHNDHVRDNGIRERHLLTNMTFDELTADQAKVKLYMLVTQMPNNEINLYMTARYEFEMVKQGDTWLIKKEVMKFDKTP